MNREETERLIADYLKGELEPEKRRLLQQLIEEGHIDHIDFKAIEQLYEELEGLPAPLPSGQSTRRFYTMLQSEKEKQQPPFSSYLAGMMKNLEQVVSIPRLVYTVAVLLAGVFIGNYVQSPGNERLEQLSAEVQQMREVVMLTMLQQPKASERLKAVNISSSLDRADKRVIEALLETLNNDPNVNVRQQAIDALLQWGNRPEVRTGLVNAIQRQDSPLVLIALADAMVVLQEERSKQKFEELLREQEFGPAVTQKLESSIAALN